MGNVEFYILDEKGSFLLGVNSSHCLFTLGNAADWLEQTTEYKNYREKVYEKRK